MNFKTIEKGLDFLADLKNVRINSMEMDAILDRIEDSLTYISKNSGLIDENEIAAIWGNQNYRFGTNRIAATIVADGVKIGVAKFAYRTTGYMDNLRTTQLVQVIASVMKRAGDDVNLRLPVPHTGVVFDRTRGKEYKVTPYRAYAPNEFDMHELFLRSKDNEGFPLIIEEYGTPMVKNEGDSFYECMRKMWGDITVVEDYEKVKDYLSQFAILSDLSPNDKGIYNTCAFERSGKLIPGFLDIGSCVVKTDNKGNVIFGDTVKYKGRKYRWDMGDLTYTCIEKDGSGRAVLEKLDNGGYLVNLLNKYTPVDDKTGSIADIDMVEHAINGQLEYLPYDDIA